MSHAIQSTVKRALTKISCCSPYLYSEISTEILAAGVMIYWVLLLNFLPTRIIIEVKSLEVYSFN